MCAKRALSFHALRRIFRPAAFTLWSWIRESAQPGAQWLPESAPRTMSVPIMELSRSGFERVRAGKDRAEFIHLDRPELWRREGAMCSMAVISLRLWPRTWPPARHSEKWARR